MVLHNPNNWHWVNKDVSGDARKYLESELIGLDAEENELSAKITGLTSMDGDVDVSQRKGKVITLFDVKLVLEWEGKTGDAENANGIITIPEVAHDTEEDEFVFEIDITSETSEKGPLKPLIRSKLVPKLRTHLLKLGPALIAEHGKDIQHAAGSNPSSGFSSPKYLSSSHINKSSDSNSAQSTTTTTQSGKGPAINVTTLNDSTEFRTEASQLYATFTDPARLGAFTRSPPQLSATPVAPGTTFALFGNNVSGSFETLEPPSLIVQKWRLKDWPQGHYSRLQIRFEQNDVDAVTVMRVAWTGVPVGQEEVTRRNWGEYYVRSIKTTFGFGTVL
ncbi:activator of 90 kDa heat shock protein ATPase-like protein 1 [Aulographum hederae CBS 113979]|uniref:Activator of 90 kDa heat shock protein ATPase-like protein 1 n=1 Tax=Aulographum hederae CBS 113979 TaxID=1176131 RepID=A0A6G1GTG2_9PEZI|nr:activator of 90 kDa heat shock protein ATPase-like protein 1 [Aulographum hederae CBS 113979]